MSKKKEPEFELKPLVEIQWEDASCCLGWHSRREALEHGPMPAKSVGYLVQKNTEFISVAQTQSADGGRGNTLAIPAAWVKKIRRLG
ncbi:MAG: hypothetical protein AB7J46_06650 [Candidatus Altimarinota bacterium]